MLSIIGKRGWAALKLDMAKAFDRVEWHFLESLIFHFNFPVNFVNLIMKCLTTTKLSFLLNGDVRGSLKPSRGLRQGVPLSPYLFILCAEGLSSLLRVRQEAHILNGIAISRHAPAISHLFFADDSLLFCTADMNSCLALQDDIRALFFQTFNLEDRPFGCKYLGLPQCLTRSKYHSFTYLCDKVASVLRGWSSKCFSRAGKEVLLKAAIQAIPAYAMACFRLPVKICKGIEAAMARFWWGSSGETRKIHWRSWKFLCQSKFRGGLGFRSLVHFNQAMLAKQACHIMQNPTSLLGRILKARYFPHSSILEAVLGHSPSFSWRSILWGRDLMASGLIWKVGTWDVGKLQSCFDESMIYDILEVPISGSYGHDKLIWEKESSGCFIVKSAYHLAFSNQDLPSSSSFSDFKKFWTRIWSLIAPPKVKLFVWRLLSNAIPVAHSLFKKCVINSPLCPVCKMENETIKHALLDCSRSRKVWRYSRFAAYYDAFKHLGIDEFFLGLLQSLDKNDIGIMFCFIWALWNQRNNFVLNQHTIPPKEVYDWSLNFFFKFLDAQQHHVTGSNSASPSTSVQISSSRGLKIFTDAAIDSVNRRHSIGVVVLDADTAVKADFSTPFSGLVPPAVAEAKAIFQAIQWAQLIRLPVDVLLVDCKSIVDRLTSCNWNNSVFDDILINVKNLLSFSPRLAISFVPRNSNVLAHKLAKLGLGLDNELVWNGSLPST
uniref:Reverse transcriptase domain-containing protein n=1 Tax=Cannabis sativa TaxID=3483 RepID=A0A803PZ76_CANSA